MSKIVIFISGIITGAYIAQTYKIPLVQNVIKLTSQKITEYERKDD
jgi:hypothetical protein